MRPYPEVFPKIFLKIGLLLRRGELHHGLRPWIALGHPVIRRGLLTSGTCWMKILSLRTLLTVLKVVYKGCTRMGHSQDWASLHDPLGRAGSLGRPNLVGLRYSLRLPPTTWESAACLQYDGVFVGMIDMSVTSATSRLTRRAEWLNGSVTGWCHFRETTMSSVELLWWVHIRLIIRFNVDAVLDSQLSNVPRRLSVCMSLCLS